MPVHFSCVEMLKWEGADTEKMRARVRSTREMRFGCLEDNNMVNARWGATWWENIVKLLPYTIEMIEYNKLKNQQVRWHHEE